MSSIARCPKCRMFKELTIDFYRGLTNQPPVGMCKDCHHWYSRARTIREGGIPRD